MAFLSWNNGTIPTPPVVTTSAAAVVAPAPSIVRAFGGPYPNTYTVSGALINQSAVRNWLGYLWVLRLFPNTLTGPGTNLLIDYGFIAADIVDPVVFFNARYEAAVLTISAPVASDDGMTIAEPVSTPPVAPLSGPCPDPLPALVSSPTTLPRGASRRADICIAAATKTSTLAARVTISISGSYDDAFDLHVLGYRAVLIATLPDWEDGKEPTIDWSYKDDIFTADTMKEQRTSTLLPRGAGATERGEAQHIVTFNYKKDGLREGNALFNRIVKAKHRRMAIPWAVEPLISDLDLLGQGTSVISNRLLSDLTWDGYKQNAEIIRVDFTDPENTVEVRNITGWNLMANELTFSHPFERSIHPGRQSLYLVRYVTLVSVARECATDTHQSPNAVYASVD